MPAPGMVAEENKPHCSQCLCAVPEAMLGKYDVVHVQLFATFIRDNDPTPVVKNLTSLLSEFRAFVSYSVRI